MLERKQYDKGNYNSSIVGKITHPKLNFALEKLSLFRTKRLFHIKTARKRPTHCNDTARSVVLHNVIKPSKSFKCFPATGGHP